LFLKVVIVAKCGPCLCLVNITCHPLAVGYEHDDELLPLDEEILAENVARDSRLHCGSGDGQDDPLLLLEEELSMTDDQHQSEAKLAALNEGCQLSLRFQGLLYHYVAVPVVRARLFVIGKALLEIYYIQYGPRQTCMVS
jgi:hypothetical protein